LITFEEFKARRIAQLALANSQDTDATANKEGDNFTIANTSNHAVEAITDQADQ
jgi:hypothetical protein